jgi:hypothetical protein
VLAGAGRFLPRLVLLAERGQSLIDIGIIPQELAGAKSRVFSCSMRRRFCIKRSKFTDNQVMAILKQTEGGVPVPELCRE